jgi:hypothetical protein
MRHASGPIMYLQFVNIIQCRQPIQTKVNDVLLHHVISKDELFSNINDRIKILCIHCINVETYNNLIFQKLFISNEIFDVVLDINAFEFKHIKKELKIPIFNI